MGRGTISVRAGRELFLQSVFLFLIAAALGLLINGLRHEGLHLLDPRAGSGPEDPYTVSLEEAHSLFLENRVVFLDARSPEAFRKGRVLGARNLPLGDLERVLPEVLADIPEEMAIVTYCDGYECDLGHNLANILREFGFQDVRTLAEGWEAWIEKGFPTEVETPKGSV